jgi:hypothetical protein
MSDWLASSVFSLSLDTFALTLELPKRNMPD